MEKDNMEQKQNEEKSDSSCETKPKNAELHNKDTSEEKFDVKQFVKVVVVIVIASLAIVLAIHFQSDKIRHFYQMHGAYNTKTEPGRETRYISIDEETNSYNLIENKKYSDKGTFEENEIGNNFIILTLTSHMGKSSSQIVWNREQVVLIGFEEEMIIFKQFVKNPVYLA